MVEVSTGKPLNKDMIGGAVELVGRSAVLMSVIKDILPQNTAISVVPAGFEGMKAGDSLGRVLGSGTPVLHANPGPFADIAVKMTGVSAVQPLRSDPPKTGPVAPKTP